MPESGSLRSSLQPFNYTVLEQLPDVVHAVYMFWSNSCAKAVYVGKAENGVRERLKQHLVGSHNHGLRMWIESDPDDLRVAYKSTTKNCVHALEKRMIYELDPIANVDHKP